MAPAAKLKWLPSPFLSVLLFFVWLYLNNTLSAGHIVLAIILAILIPLLTSPFRTKQPLMVNYGLAFRHLMLVLYDIVTANMQVAILILGPNKKLTPGFVMVPLDLTHNTSITILASTVSLTPGTVSAEVLPWREDLESGKTLDKRFLLIHVLNLEDEETLIKTIKARYEAPLREIFKC